MFRLSGDFGTYRLHIIFVLVYICFIFSSLSFSQVGFKTPLYNFSSSFDSTRVSFPRPVLPLRNWQEHSDQYFNLKAVKNVLDISQYISVSNIYPSDPFKTDRRGNSYYVPRMVRDELNLIMNRPKDNAFVPIFPVAFLAVQLASQYLIIQQKTEITYHDIELASEGVPLLEELWKKNPQTLSELYKAKSLRKRYTMMELQRLMDILVDNKLVKRKLIEKSETQYFYALDKKRYHQVVERGKIEKNYTTPKQRLSPSVELTP